MKIRLKRNVIIGNTLVRAGAIIEVLQRPIRRAFRRRANEEKKQFILQQAKELGLDINRMYFSSNSLEVNYKGALEIKDKNITEFPFKFGKVFGDFSCSGCFKLKSLENGPIYTKSYDCSGCAELKNLKGVSQNIENFNCKGCKKLESLEGLPNKVTGWFDCSFCKSLKSLEGAPSYIDKGFNCNACHNLRDLKGCPIKIMGEFKCQDCASLTSLEGMTDRLDTVNLSYNKVLLTLEGISKYINKDLYLTGCGGDFTLEDVEKHTKVYGQIHGLKKDI